MSERLLHRGGRRRSPATLPGFHAGHAPGNKGLRYPADPPKVEEIIAVMRTAGDGAHGRRLRGLIVIMWRAGLRIQGSPRAQRGRSRSPTRLIAGAARQGRAPCEVGMDAWGWEQLQPWARAAARASGRSAAVCHQRCDARAPLVAGRGPRRAAAHRRFAPHQLRHAHAVELAREGVPLIVIQRQLGHSNLGITSVYLQGIDSGEIIETVHAQRAPMMPVSVSLRL